MHELLERMKDEQLLLEIEKGNELAMDTLLNRYFSLVKYRVREYYLSGGEEEDLLQEGYIGLFKAVRSYDKNKNDAFYPFAKMCIENQLRTAVKASNRKKHLPLNTSVSMDDEWTGEFQTQEGNPEKIVLAKELEADRLILRKEYPQIPPKVEYSLSDRGKSLMAVLDQLCVWGEENRPDV